MSNNLSGKYYIKKGTDALEDMTTKWNGLTILKIEDFLSKGKPKNIYTQSWINSNEEDVYIPDEVFFENTDVSITFIVRDKDSAIDVVTTHNSFIDYVTKNRVTIKSMYINKSADFVCLDDYKPTTTMLQRGSGNNYIMGTIKLHRVNSLT